MGLLSSIIFGPIASAISPAAAPLATATSAPAAAPLAATAAASPDRLALGRQIFDFFVQRGLEPHQAAAIAGNMVWEGGGRTDLVNPGDNLKNSPRSPHSVGIGQWNDRAPSLIQFARSRGIDLPEGDTRDARYMRDVIKRIPLNTQLEFAWNEMQGPESRAFSALRGGGDLRSATAGAISYHRPAGWSWRNPEAGHGFSGRLSLAEQIMQAAQGGAPASVPTQVAQATGPQSPVTPGTTAVQAAAAGPQASGGLLASILNDTPLESFLTEAQDQQQQNRNLVAMAASQGGKSSPIAPPPQPKLDLARIRELMQRRGLLGTMEV